MASQWGESISADFCDVQATAMAVDCLGKWAVLGGRHVLTLVDLDNPLERSIRVSRQSKWEISCIQWNPHASHAKLFTTACAQRLDLYSWEDGSSKQLCFMKAHSRNISDMDWSPFDVNVIASCSVDTFTLLWDVRDPKRPIGSFQSVCGTSQVKWNKVTNNLFATAHEGDIRIWDPRKGNMPLVFLTAHLSKIHGVDWNPAREPTFATSSQDCSVKFWDYTNPRQDKGTLKSGSPVWRAKFTPFGDGLVTVVMSTLRRGENSMYLWNTNNLDHPVHQFVGHSDVVLEFYWRKKDETNQDYQLVTWSKDQNLKIWKVDSQLQRLCGHDILDMSENESSMLSSIETLKDTNEHSSSQETVACKHGEDGDLDTSVQSSAMYNEFSLVNKDIPNVTIEKMDTSSRQCSLSVSAGKHVIYLNVIFPANYPNGATPMFEMSSPTGVTEAVMKKLKKVIIETSQNQVKRSLNCLEPCIRQFATAFENMTIEERKTPDSDGFSTSSSKIHPTISQRLPYSTFQDSFVPFPRTCGANFNSAGLLSCFGRSREASKGSEKTPKTLAELASFTSTNRVRNSKSNSGFTTMYSRSPPTSVSEPVSISSYYMMKRTRTRSRNFKDAEFKLKNTDKMVKKEKKSVKVEPVRVYDTHCLLTVHKELGEKYSLNLNDIHAMCEHNKKEAAAVGRHDLVRLWSLVPIIYNAAQNPPNNADDGKPFAQRPCGRKIVEFMMDYYKSLYDVQTLAMLCCIFGDRWHFNQSLNSQDMKKSASKVSLDYFLPNMLLEAMVKIRRSNSCTDLSFEDYKFTEDFSVRDHVDLEEKRLHDNNCRMLDPSKYIQYDHFLKSYADILYRWGLRNQFAHLMKHVTIPPEPHIGIEFGVHCEYCRADVRGIKCAKCKTLAFRCVICNTGVRGTSNFCLNCGHGGHASHMKEWFKQEVECPTGCGCQCLKWNPF